MLKIKEYDDELYIIDDNNNIITVGIYQTNNDIFDMNLQITFKNIDTWFQYYLQINKE